MYKLNSLIILIIFVLLTGVSLASTIDTNVVNLGGATGTLAIVHGGTGATTANGALSSLGIEDSTNQSILVPNGATFQEPSPGVDGMIRYNTTTNQLETYNSSGTWQNIFVTGGSGGALSIGNGGTGATDASGALKNISGVYNASACGYTNKPSWCSGSDIGAWINAAASDIGTSSSRYGKIIIDTANYNFSTSIALPNNIVLDCQASLLNYTSISGAALVVGGANGGNQFNPSSVEHCRIAHTSGYTTGNTNLGVYLGGDPTGSLSSSSNYAPSVLLLEADIYGFKQGLSKPTCKVVWLDPVRRRCAGRSAVITSNLLSE